MAKSLSASLLPSLPPELVGIVLKLLNKEDLFNVRITCKAMSCYAAPLVFEELHVWLEEQSLQSLINIASDPILRKNVRKLIIGMDYFYDFSYEIFKDFIYPYDYNPDPTRCLNGSELAQRREAWKVYRKYYLKQCALEKSGRDLAMMTQALRAFSSLLRVSLMDYQPWCDEYEEPRLLKSESLLQTDFLTVPNDHIRIPRGGRQIRVLLQALAASDRKIGELSLEINSSNIEENGIYGPLPKEFHSITVQALSHLQKLNLVVFDPIDPALLAAWKKNSQELSLTTILRAATQLECLWVEMPPDDDELWNNYIQIPRVGQLRELRVSEVVFHEADFVLFLSSSCQGLQRLALASAKVKEESWGSIFETIRSLPNLEYIDFDILWHKLSNGGAIWLDYTNAQPVYDYLLRKRENIPWDDMCEVDCPEYLKKKLLH